MDDAAAPVHTGIGTIIPIEPIIKVERLHALGIIVADLEKSMREFSRFFGLEAWKVRSFKTGRNLKITGADGASQEAEILLATASTNGVVFELYQPVSGDTVYSQFLKKGDRAHDMTVAVLSQAEFEAVRQRMAKEGVPILQSVSLGDQADVHYFDSFRQLAAVVKVVVPKAAGVRSLEDLPADRTVRHELVNGHFPCDKAYHVCVNTNWRRLSVRESYARIFGIKDWFEFDCITGFNQANPRHRGRPADWSFRTMSGRRDAFAIEIVETVWGESGYTDMLNDYGEGIHHLMTAFCDKEAVEATQKALAEEDYEYAQEGDTGPIYYCYLQKNGRLASLGIEAVCPIDDSWQDHMVGAMRDGLFGPDRPDYAHPPLINKRG